MALVTMAQGQPVSRAAWSIGASRNEARRLIESAYQGGVKGNSPQDALNNNAAMATRKRARLPRILSARRRVTGLSCSQLVRAEAA